MAIESERIEAEIQRLKREQAEVLDREAEEAEAILARQRAAEKQRQEQEAEATRQLPIQLARQRREDAERERQWWDDRRANCYTTPSNTQFYQWGLCAYFVDYCFNDDLQPCDWCAQCQHGWQNPWQRELRRHGIANAQTTV